MVQNLTFRDDKERDYAKTRVHRYLRDAADNGCGADCGVHVGWFTVRLFPGLRDRARSLHVRPAPHRDQHDIYNHDQHRCVQRCVWPGQPVQQRAQPEQRGKHRRRGAGRELALVDSMARPEQRARGPPRAGGARPLLCPRPHRPLHEQPREFRQRERYPAGRLRHRRPRPGCRAHPGGS